MKVMIKWNHSLSYHCIPCDDHCVRINNLLDIWYVYEQTLSLIFNLNHMVLHICRAQRKHHLVYVTRIVLGKKRT